VLPIGDRRLSDHIVDDQPELTIMKKTLFAAVITLACSLAACSDNSGPPTGPSGPRNDTKFSAPFAGYWLGNYIVEQCHGTGVSGDRACIGFFDRVGHFAVGSSRPLILNLTQNGSDVSGYFDLGSRGDATGVVNVAGVMTLQGTTTGRPPTYQITSWSTTVQGNVMEGSFTFTATEEEFPGVTVVVARLSGVTKVPVGSSSSRAD
jgi:hypothetical protein